MSETIFAQATSPGRAGVAIIRVSGPAAHDAAARLTGGPLPARVATLRRLRDPRTAETIDDALLLHFPAPASYTGETVVEIQCHGSPAVTKRLLLVLGTVSGLRLAQPGEFTRRALENGRLDLSQVEGLGDLLAAETEAQRRQALAVASGALSGRVEGFRLALIEALALVEAVIDFGEDGVPASALETVPGRIGGVLAGMDAMLAGSAAAERIRDGFVVAICGAPNVGKSTLLNAIAGREVALTSEVAGTTRDVLEVHLDLRGLPVTLLDTAGLREADDAVERLGIERARRRAESADLRVFLVERGKAAFEMHMQEGDLVVAAKADLISTPGALSVSGLTGDGVDGLLDRIAHALEARVVGASGLAHQRQREAMQDARGSLACALDLLTSPDQALEVSAFELRAAIRGLDLFVGRLDVEAVLDHVFRKFCLGK